MKRGFLLSAPKKSRRSPNSYPPKAPQTSTFPQCKATDGDASKQQKRRIVATSSDLLDLETERDTPSLFQVVDGEFSPGNEFVTVDENNDQSTGSCENKGNSSLLDNWALSDSSTSQPLILPSQSKQKSFPSQRNNTVKRERGPLIVEIENSSKSDIEKNNDFEELGGAGSNPVEAISLDLIEDITATHAALEVEGSSAVKPTNTQHEHEHSTSEKDALHFANELSLLLSRLRRRMKSKNNQHGQHKVVDFESLFNGMYMSIDAEMHVKEFVNKHFQLNDADHGNPQPQQVLNITSKLVEMGRHILEPIAQDYSANTSGSSQKKRKKNTSMPSWTSPSLAVGLCILAYSNRTEIIHVYLENILFGAAKPKTTNVHLVADQNEDKQKKVFALGAVCLLRCWIRTLGVKLSRWELDLDCSPRGDATSINECLTHVEDIRLKAELLLSKLLPALLAVVDLDAKRTVLAQAAMDASFELIESAARTTLLLNTTPINHDLDQLDILSSMVTWKDALPNVNRLLIVKQGWTSTSIDTSNKEREGDHDSSASRSRCLNSVIYDWREVVKLSKRSFYDYFVGQENHSQLHEGADLAAGLALLWNLSGAKIKKNQTCADGDNPTEVFVARLGGISQSLCQHQECTTGYISDSIVDCSGDVAVADLLSTLEEAIRMSCKPRQGDKDTGASVLTIKILQISTIRAFVSWLSKSKKNLRELTKASTSDSDYLTDRAVEILMSCLRLESKACVNLSLAALSTLWDLSTHWHSQPCTRSFSELLDALRIHSDEAFLSEEQDKKDGTHLESTTSALCILVAKIASQEPELLLPLVLKFTGSEEVMIEVLMSVIAKLPESNYVQKSVLEALLDHVDTVSFSRAKLLSHQTYFYQMPCCSIIPPILDYLTKKYSEKTPSHGVASVSMFLRNVMIAKAGKDQSYDFVTCVLRYFQSRCEKAMATKFIEKNVSTWRSALLETTTPDFAYSSVVLATSKSMLDNPSSRTPVSLLSCLVRVGEDFSETDHVKKRVYIATSSIIELAASQLSESRNNNHACPDSDVFTSITPLLILRCIPRSYYRTFHEALLEEGARSAMTELSRLLVGSIKTQALNNDKTDLGKEERRLVAEVAGHVLPFSCQLKADPAVGGKNSPSLFEDVCKGPFYDVLHVIRTQQLSSQQDIICHVVESKSALYAVCHHLPFADNNDEGVALLNVASFAMEVLQHDPTVAIIIDNSNKELILEEFMMLRTGCMSFIALAFHSLSIRKVNNINTKQQNKLVQEVTVLPSEMGIPHRFSIIESLSAISRMVVAAITTGETDQRNLPLNFSGQIVLGGNDLVTLFSPSSRTAMLNSMVMLSQKSQGHELHWVAQNILPLLVKWALSPVDDSIHHPLCIAAGLQVVYTLLARIGSFDWTQASNGTDCLILRCALNLFDTKDTCNSPDISILRLAALKLMLTVLTIRTTSKREAVSYLSPVEVKKAVQAVNAAARLDKHPEVRSLASEVVPRLNHMMSL